MLPRSPESSKAEEIFVMLFASSHSSLSFLCVEFEINAIRKKKRSEKKVAQILQCVLDGKYKDNLVTDLRFSGMSRGVGS